MLEALKAKILKISQQIGGIQNSKPIIKASLRFLLPGVGEVLAEGIDDIFELATAREDQQRHEALDQKLSRLQDDQALFINLLDKIDQKIGHILQDISNSYQANLKAIYQANSNSSNQSLQDQQKQEQLLKDLFDQQFQKESQQFQVLQSDLMDLSKQFILVQKQMDTLLQ
jgi:hypothetical protein